MMKLSIGADHRGLEAKQYVLTAITTVEWIDAGCENIQSCDFPLYAERVTKQVKNKEVDAGVLICGSGIGMSVVANRFDGIYAALVWNKEVAISSKEHNNANILVIPSDYVSKEETVEMIQAWMQAKFLGDKYQERIDMIDKL